MKYNLGKGDLPVDQDHGSSLPVHLWSVHLSIDFSEHPSIDSLKWRRCSMRPLKTGHIESGARSEEPKQNLSGSGCSSGNTDAVYTRRCAWSCVSDVWMRLTDKAAVCLTCLSEAPLLSPSTENWMAGAEPIT